MENKIDRERSLRVSVLDGIFAAVMSGFTANFITPFALALGAKDFLIGLVNSLPSISSSIASLSAADIAEKICSRLKTIKIFAALEALMLLFIAFIPIFAHGTKSVYVFISLLVGLAILGAIEGPNWTSLMGDLVEKNKYGEYFSYRGKVTGFVELLSVFLAGFILSGFGENNTTGFVALFSIAAICRFISAFFISCMDDVPMEIKPEKKFGYLTFIKRLPKSNFVKFVLFMSLVNFAVNLSAPFFSVYLLRDLKFSYVTYTIVNVSTALVALLGMSFWGKVADKHGNAKVIKFTALLIGLFPVLLIFSPNLYFIICINMFSGYIWSGMNLCTTNYILDSATPAVRTRCLSYFRITNSFFSFLGAILGGVLATVLPNIFGYKLLTLFVLSGILRVLIGLSLSGLFKEVRPAEDIQDVRLLFRMLGLEPILSYGEDIFIRFKKPRR